MELVSGPINTSIWDVDAVSFINSFEIYYVLLLLKTENRNK